MPQAQFRQSIDELPARPLLVVANEFLDALPVRQFVGSNERRVVVAAGGLAFDRDGHIVEDSPARERAVRSIARRVVASGGVALVIDYGHHKGAAGETLQAVRDHRFASVLERPGEQDLTAHVDFEAIGFAARDAGAAVSSVASQGEWLNRLGIEVRAQTLSSTNPERADEIAGALHRLTASDAMGGLFKVLAIHSPEWPVPAGFS